MRRHFSNLLQPRVIGALVTCGAVLGIASLIHPTDSAAVPWQLEAQLQAELGAPSGDATMSLGTLEGRGFEAELLAGTPEARVRVDDAMMSLDEFLYLEHTLVPDQEHESGDAWPEAIMEVDVPVDPW